MNTQSMGDREGFVTHISLKSPKEGPESTNSEHTSPTSHSHKLHLPHLNLHSPITSHKKRNSKTTGKGDDISQTQDTESEEALEKKFFMRQIESMNEKQMILEEMSSKVVTSPKRKGFFTKKSKQSREEELSILDENEDDDDKPVRAKKPPHPGGKGGKGRGGRIPIVNPSSSGTERRRATLTPMKALETRVSRGSSSGSSLDLNDPLGISL